MEPKDKIILERIWDLVKKMRHDPESKMQCVMAQELIFRVLAWRLEEYAALKRRVTFAVHCKQARGDFFNRECENEICSQCAGLSEAHCTKQSEDGHYLPRSHRKPGI